MNKRKPLITSHGYRKIYVKEGHHLADSKGYAYEHRIVAEIKLGKLLVKGELVHHINGNKLDNEPENLSVEQGHKHHLFHHRKRNNRQKPNEDNVSMLCQCGCGQSFLKFDNVGRPRKFISSHNIIRWSKKEIQILLNEYPFKENYEISKNISKSEAAIRNKAKELGIKKMVRFHRTKAKAAA